VLGDQFSEVVVLGDENHGTVGSSRSFEDGSVLGHKEVELLHMMSLEAEVGPKPAGHRGWELGVDPEPGRSASVVRSLAVPRGHPRLGRDNRVIELTCRVEEARSDVVRLEVRILG
jgi:hypothetical protein